LSQHARLLLRVCLREQLRDHLPEWGCLIGAKGCRQSLADQLRGRRLRHLTEMINRLTRLRSAAAQVLLQQAA